MNQNPCEIDLPDIRVAHDKNYVANVGLAMYVFAGLEGLICEVIDFFIQDFRYYVARENALTSGLIREKLLLVLQDEHIQYQCFTKRELEDFHDEFFDLVERRNALIHARPATAPGGKLKVLNYQAFKNKKYLDVLWLIEDVQQFTRDVSAAQYTADAIRMKLRNGSPVRAWPLACFPSKPVPNGRVHAGKTSDTDSLQKTIV